MTHTLGDQPIQPEYSHQMEGVARALDQVFNGETKGSDRKTGFVLMVFGFNDAGTAIASRCNYISNGADRNDVVTLMKEMVARFEGQPELTGRG